MFRNVQGTSRGGWRQAIPPERSLKILEVVRGSFLRK